MVDISQASWRSGEATTIGSGGADQWLGLKAHKVSGSWEN